MRVSGAVGAIQWINDIDVTKLDDADAAFDPDADHRFPESQDVVYVTGEDGHHALLAQVPPGRKIAFQGRIYETKADATAGQLQIRNTGITINRVTNTFKRRTDTLVDLTIRYSENGRENTISGTPEHPFFVPAVSDYVAMGELEVGTVLRTTDGSEATVVASETRHGDFDVYNLEVEHAHNYFVSAPGSDCPGVLVHNTCKVPHFNGPKPRYHVNPAHVPGRGLRPGKTPLPPDAESVFKNAVPNDPTRPTAWFGKNADGQVYRYSLGNDGTAHFSGIRGVGDGTRNLTDYAIQRLGGP